MPTTRPRYTLTETDDLAHALDSASRMWPELRDDRAALLRRLIERGAKSVDSAVEARLAERLEALRELSGSLAGVYPSDARRALLEEWPE